MKQQTNTPTPRDAASSALASAEEMSHPPELQGNRRKGRKEGTDEDMSRPAELQGNLRKGRGKPTDACSLALASGVEMHHPPELEGNYRQDRARREIKATDEEEDASSDEEIRPGAVFVAGVFTGPPRPSVLSEAQGPSAIGEQSTIIAELAEPSQEDEEVRRRLQELEQNFDKIVRGAVQGTVVVENSGGGDDDQNAALSPFGRKRIIFLIGAALALLLVVAVILGVAIPLTTNKDKDSPSIDSTVTPTESPAPTEAPSAAPTACTSRECLLGKILLQHEVSGAEALRDDSSPQSRALRWLANDDPIMLDLDSTPTLFERYILAVLYFATSGEGWGDQSNFLSATSVCDWNNDLRGAVCNEDDMVVDLNLSKSKHEEVIIQSELGKLTWLTKLSLCMWIGLS
jgi:hypothetical protein